MTISMQEYFRTRKADRKKERRAKKNLKRDVPSVTIEHQYLVTEPIPALQGREQHLPLLRDPDSSYYLRQEKDGLLLGPYEQHATPRWTQSADRIPSDFSFAYSTIVFAFARYSIAKYGSCSPCSS